MQRRWRWRPTSSPYDAHDTATALQLFDRALELSSFNVFALSMSAMTLAWMGRAEIAVERAERAMRLSPFDPYNFRSRHALAIVCFHRRQYGAAVDAARDAIRHNPKFGIARAVLAASLLRLGRAEEAKAAGRDLLECEPSFTIAGRSRTAGFQPAVFAPFAEAWREIGLPE